MWNIRGKCSIIKISLSMEKASATPLAMSSLWMQSIKDLGLQITQESLMITEVNLALSKYQVHFISHLRSNHQTQALLVSTFRHFTPDCNLVRKKGAKSTNRASRIDLWIRLLSLMTTMMVPWASSIDSNIPSRLKRRKLWKNSKRRSKCFPDTLW